jgi:hypothetical protein
MGGDRMSPQAKRIAAHKAAIAEANRFIAKARMALADLEAEGFSNGSPATASAKRASMDLTRALADLRRNPWGDA